MLTVYALRVATTCGLLLVQAAVASSLTPTEFGRCAIIWTAILVLAGIAPLGFARGATRVLAVERAIGRWSDLQGYVRAGLLVTLGTGALLASLAWIAWTIVDPGVGGNGVAVRALLLVPILALFRFAAGIARSGTRGVWVVGASALFGQAVMVAALGWTEGGSASTATVLHAALLGTAGALAPLIAFLAFEVRVRTPRAAPRYRWRRWLADCWPTACADAAVSMLRGCAVLILGLLAVPADAGAFYVLICMARLATGAHFDEAAAVVGSRRSNAALSADGATRLLRERGQIGALITAAAGACVLGLAPPLLQLFGLGGDAPVRALTVLVLGQVCASLFGTADETLTARGAEGSSAAIALGATATGAATAVAGAAIVRALLSAFVAWWRFGVWTPVAMLAGGAVPSHAVAR